jgi:hypothetical protein
MRCNLDVIEETYNQDPSLSIHLKKNPRYLKTCEYEKQGTYISISAPINQRFLKTQPNNNNNVLWLRNSLGGWWCRFGTVRAFVIFGNCANNLGKDFAARMIGRDKPVDLLQSTSSKKDFT